MDIAALSMDMHATELQRNVGLAMVKKTMDTQEVEAQLIERMLMPSPYNFDVRA